MADKLPPLKIGVLHCTPHVAEHTPNANLVGSWVIQNLKQSEPRLEITELDAGSLLIQQDLGPYFEKSYYATYPDPVAVSGRSRDQMRQVYELLLTNHAVLFTTEIRTGGTTALMQTILERMQSALMAPRGIGTPLKGKVASIIAVGHSDGASNAVSRAMHCLSLFRMIFPETAYVTWSGTNIGGPTHFDRLKLEESGETKAWAAQLAGSLLETTQRQVADGKIAQMQMLHPEAFKPGFLRDVISDMRQSGFSIDKQGAENYLHFLMKDRRMNRMQLMPYWAVLRVKFKVGKYPELKA